MITSARAVPTSAGPIVSQPIARRVLGVYVISPCWCSGSVLAMSENPPSVYSPRVDVRLEEARDACDAGRVEKAIALVSRVVAEADDELDVVEAATLVPPPVDPLMRARVHLLTAEAATRVSSPALVERLDRPVGRDGGPLPAGDTAHGRGDGRARPDGSAVRAPRRHRGLRHRGDHRTGPVATPPPARGAGTDGRAVRLCVRAHVATARSLGGPGSDAFYLDPVFGSARARLTGHDHEQMVSTVRGLVEELRPRLGVGSRSRS